MWYYLMKFEGILVTPLFLIYYALRGIPFFTRCTKCHRWLLDQQYLRSGICEKCCRQMASSEAYQLYQETIVNVAIHPVSPGQEHLHRRIVKRLRNGKVLDIGCGLGKLLSRVQSEGRELYGLDISQAAVRIAKASNKEANFFVADAQSMPFKSNTFDYAICTELLEHIIGNEVIKECYRVLKPKGVALITVPNGKGPSGKYFPKHIRLFSFDSINTFIEQEDFKIISKEKFGLRIPFVTRFFEMLSMALGKNLPFCPVLNIEVPEFLATSFLIECRKPPILSSRKFYPYLHQL